METTTIQQDGIAIVVLSRNIIGNSVYVMRQQLIKQIDKPERPRILIDFGQVHKMDSSGLGTLTQVYCMAKSKHGHIGIINVGTHIKSLIIRSRLITLFEHFESESEAVSAFSGLS